MSVARINLVEFNSERDADEISADYAAKAAMENAAEARKARMERMKDRVKNVEMFEGEVNLSHSK